MKKLFFLFVLLITATAFCKLEITIDLPATEFLPGLKMNRIVKAKFTNVGNTPIKTVYPVCDYNWNYFIEMKSDKGIPPSFMNASGLRLVMSEKDIHVLLPDETAECNFESYVFILPGEYHFRFVFDPAKSLALEPEYSTGLYAEKITSEWKTIRIIQPAGQDKEIFDKYFSKENMFDWIEISWEEIVKKYPSSNYAIWFFARDADYVSPTESSVKAIMDHIQAGKSVKKLDQKMASWGQQRIDSIQSLLNLHPDFMLAAWMQYEIAYWHLYRGDFDAAFLQAKGIVEKYKGKRSGMKAQEIMDFLLQKGLVKKN